MRGRLRVQKSQSVEPYGRRPRGVNVKVPSPSLEELTVHYRNETHTLTTKYRATTLGAPQRGQLLGPGQTEASWRALTAGQQFTPRQKTGEGNAHLSLQLPFLHKSLSEPRRQVHRGHGPDASRPEACPSPLPSQGSVLGTVITLQLLARGGWQRGFLWAPWARKNTLVSVQRAVGLPFSGCRKTHTGVTWEVPRAPPQAGEMEAQVQATSAPALIFPSPRSGREAGGGRDPETHPFL